MSGNSGSTPHIEDLKMGEYFTIALSAKGVVYSWGMNDKGQLGIGTEVPSLVPQQVQNLLPKSVQKIDCGLKHCLMTSFTSGTLFSTIDLRKGSSLTSSVSPGLLNQLRMWIPFSG